jgi:hypothetical protein
VYPYSKAVADELRTLRLVYRLAIEALDDHRLVLPITRRSWEIWDHADQFILESVNEQLNRIVDGSITSAYLVLRNGLTIEESRLPRRLILQQFQDRFHIDAATLPGWQSVVDVARDANASKHRSGVHWKKGSNGMAVFAGTVQLYRRTVNGRIRNVGRWLRAFGTAHHVP